MLVEVTWFEVLGLIGVTIAISRGKILDGLRKWLLAFEHPFNPFRILGKLLSCSMCSGFWVGIAWGDVRGFDFWTCVISGGFVSLVSFVADNVTGILEYACEKAENTEPYKMTLAELAKVRQQLREQRQIVLGAPRPTSQEISEEEADAIADEADRIADEAVVPREELEK